jgi:hypothetical protein
MVEAESALAAERVAMSLPVWAQADADHAADPELRAPGERRGRAEAVGLRRHSTAAGRLSRASSPAPAPGRSRRRCRRGPGSAR